MLDFPSKLESRIKELLLEDSEFIASLSSESGNGSPNFPLVASRLLEALESDRMIVPMISDFGSGKTTLVRELVCRLDEGEIVWLDMQEFAGKKLPRIETEASIICVDEAAGLSFITVRELLEAAERGTKVVLFYPNESLYERTGKRLIEIIEGENNDDELREILLRIRQSCSLDELGLEGLKIGDVEKGVLNKHSDLVRAAIERILLPKILFSSLKDRIEQERKEVRKVDMYFDTPEEAYRAFIEIARIVYPDSGWVNLANRHTGYEEFAQRLGSNWSEILSNIHTAGGDGMNVLVSQSDEGVILSFSAYYGDLSSGGEGVPNLALDYRVMGIARSFTERGIKVVY